MKKYISFLIKCNVYALALLTPVAHSAEEPFPDYKDGKSYLGNLNIANESVPLISIDIEGKIFYDKNLEEIVKVAANESVPFIDGSLTDAISSICKYKKYDDKRQKIDPGSVLHSPHSAIFSIETIFENSSPSSKTCGTAVMIHKQIALTAAHNVYSRKGGHAKKITSFMSRYGNTFTETLEVKKYAVLKAYVGNQDDKNNDYALLFFSTKIGDDQGWIFPAYCDEMDKDINHATISGYPLWTYMDGDVNETDGKFPYEHTSAIHRDRVIQTDNLLVHEIHTTTGQSGAPLRVTLKNSENQIEWRLIGVHVQGMTDKEENLAMSLLQKDSSTTKQSTLTNKSVRITKTVFNNIREISNALLRGNQPIMSYNRIEDGSDFFLKDLEYRSN